jgi:hypothetical protein
LAPGFGLLILEVGARPFASVRRATTG